MKIFGMRIAGVVTACLLGLVWLIQPGRMMAQAAAPAGRATASVHGHVQDPLAVALAGGVVKLSTDRNRNTVNRNYEYQFPIDNNGDYKGAGIKPGTYLMTAFSNKGVDVDYQTTPLAAGEDKAVDFDMSRKAYIDAMGPAERDAMEQIKKQNADIMAKNAKIENLNALLKQARADTQAGNFASAIKAMTDATTAKPDEAILWDDAGRRATGRSSGGEQRSQGGQNDRRVGAGQVGRGGGLVPEGAHPECGGGQAQPDTAAVANNQLGAWRWAGWARRTGGCRLPMMQRPRQTRRAPGSTIYNEAMTLYNASLKTGKVDGLAEAADKAIAADPTRAEAYYLKTQVWPR